MSNHELGKSPAELVAIANAAHRIGDKQLEQSAKRELKSRFDIEIKFGRKVKREATPC